MDSKARLDTARINYNVFTETGSVHRRSVSGGKQIRQGLGRDKVEGKQAEVKYRQTLGTREKCWNAYHEDKRRTGNGRGNTGTIYTQRRGNGKQVKVIRAGQINH